MTVADVLAICCQSFTYARCVTFSRAPVNSGAQKKCPSHFTATNTTGSGLSLAIACMYSADWLASCDSRQHNATTCELQSGAAAVRDEFFGRALQLNDGMRARRREGEPRKNARDAERACE